MPQHVVLQQMVKVMAFDICDMGPKKMTELLKKKTYKLQFTTVKLTVFGKKKHQLLLTLVQVSILKCEMYQLISSKVH